MELDYKCVVMLKDNCVVFVPCGKTVVLYLCHAERQLCYICAMLKDNCVVFVPC